MYQGCEIVGGQLCGGGVGGTADEGGQKSVTIGGAAGEEGGIPDGAEDAETGGARHEEAKAVQGVGDGRFRVAEGDDGDGGEFDGAE